MDKNGTILAVGTMAFDSIETPFAKGEKVLGGSLNYFSLSASYFTHVQCVSVVGRDFPQSHLELMEKKGADISGIEQKTGNTFFWAGKYSYNLNEAQTLETHLNVFEDFDPRIPNHFKKTPLLFLGNIPPALQLSVLDQVEEARFVAVDTMNFWIQGSKPKLKEVIGKCDAMIINEGEARQLSERYSIVTAGKEIQSWGPKIVLIKRGEYGLLLFYKDELFALPGLPLADVIDPTGAGDSFAGGFLGYLSSRKHLDLTMPVLNKAAVYGSVMASMAVEGLGISNLVSLNEKEIELRYKEFVNLTNFHQP